MQRQMEKRVHLAGLGSELLLQREGGVLEQSAVLGMMRDQVGCGDFGAFEDRTLAMLAPGLAEELSDLFTACLLYTSRCV